MAGQLRNEDMVLAQHLGGKSTELPEIGSKAGYLGSGISAVYDGPTSEQRALEQALHEACSVTICGVAPRSLVDAMQRLARRYQVSGSPQQWDEITYITPAPVLVFANHENVRLGAVVQRWQSALNGIRNCSRQLAALEAGVENSAQTHFEMLGMTELYVEVVIELEDRQTGRKRCWVSVGPAVSRDDVTFLVIDEGHEMYERVTQAVDSVRRGSVPIVTRQLECDNNSPAPKAGNELPALRVSGLHPVGAAHGADDHYVLPVAITILRSAAAGEQIVLLKRRTEFADNDDFAKLSLLSARLLEEDLAGAINVPLFAGLEPSDALDAMWKAHGHSLPLTLGIRAFRRAAQREIFVSCGLDVSEDRLRYVGWQSAEREDGSGRLFYCVFEVVLYRRGDHDELQLAETWNRDNLERVAEHLLYSDQYGSMLNRLLRKRQSWLMEKVFSNSVDTLISDNRTVEEVTAPGELDI